MGDVFSHLIVSCISIITALSRSPRDHKILTVLTEQPYCVTGVLYNKKMTDWAELFKARLNEPRVS